VVGAEVDSASAVAPLLTLKTAAAQQGSSMGWHCIWLLKLLFATALAAAAAPAVACILQRLPIFCVS
jgi:hypothetical protein